MTQGPHSISGYLRPCLERTVVVRQRSVRCSDRGARGHPTLDSSHGLVRELAVLFITAHPRDPRRHMTAAVVNEARPGHDAISRPFYCHSCIAHMGELVSCLPSFSLRDLNREGAVVTALMVAPAVYGGGRCRLQQGCGDGTEAGRQRQPEATAAVSARMGCCFTYLFGGRMGPRTVSRATSISFSAKSVTARRITIAICACLAPLRAC